MSSKQQYLIDENQQLSDQVAQLKLQLQLNKQALSISMDNNKGPGICKNCKNQEKSGLGRLPLNNNENNQEDKSEKDKDDNQNQSEIQKLTEKFSKQQETLNQVIVSLQEENENLQNTINKINEERNVISGKSMVHEQMYEEVMRQKSEILEDMKWEKQGYIEKIKEMEQSIHQLEKEKPTYDQISGVVVKYREIINVNEQTIKMHEEQERLNYVIMKQAKEISKLRFNNEDLTSLNYQLSQQIVRYKTMHYQAGGNFQIMQQQQPILQQQQQVQQQQMPLQLNLGKLPNVNENNKINVQLSQNNLQTDGGMETENALDKSALILMNLHKKIMDGGSESDSEEEKDLEEIEKQCLSPMMSPLPDKVIHNLNTINATQMGEIKPPVKQLDLSRAFQIQEINAKRSTQIQLQKEQKQPNILAITQDKLGKSEMLLNESRKNLAREMLQNKTMMLLNEEMKRNIEELEGRNEIFINSNHLYEQKWKDIYHAYCYYKEFYQDFKENPEQYSALKTKDQQSNSKTVELDSPEKIIRQRKRKNKNLDTSIMDVNINAFKDIQIEQQAQMNNLQNNNNINNFDQNNNNMEVFGKENAQNYLKNMASDLEYQMNQFYQSPQNQQKTTTTRRLQRSNSNPIDYIPVQEDLYKHNNIMMNVPYQQQQFQQNWNNNNMMMIQQQDQQQQIPYDQQQQQQQNFGIGLENANKNNHTAMNFNQFQGQGYAIQPVKDMEDIDDEKTIERRGSFGEVN